jgi:hypothetical protein
MKKNSAVLLSILFISPVFSQSKTVYLSCSTLSLSKNYIEVQTFIKNERVENRYSRTKIKFNRVTGRLDEQIYFTKQNGDIINNYGYEYQCSKTKPIFE